MILIEENDKKKTKKKKKKRGGKSGQDEESNDENGPLEVRNAIHRIKQEPKIMAYWIYSCASGGQWRWRYTKAAFYQVNLRYEKEITEMIITW